MATARKKGGGSKTARKAKPAAKSKTVPARKPAARPVARAAGAAAKAAKPVKAVKPSKPSKPAKPAPQLKPAKSAVAVRPTAKGGAKRPPVLNAGARAALALKGLKTGTKPGEKPVPKGPRRLVPATAAAKAAAAKPVSGKSKYALKSPPEVRPLGVLPPESIAKPRHVVVRPVASAARMPAPSRPAVIKKGDDRLSPDDIKHFEERLLGERARIMREMGHLESTVLKVNPRDSAGELSGYSFHMADAGTDSMEREKAFDIASKEGRLLMEIDDALRRLYNGTYGICEVSGKPISRARLEALPWARLSLEEQEKLEREQRAGRTPPASAE